MNRTAVSRWRRINSLAGRVVFGFPALVALIAFTVTLTRLGAGAALAAAPVCLIGLLPTLLWDRYRRRDPAAAPARIMWGTAGLVVAAATLVSPLYWWSAPTLAVIVSEWARVHRGRRRTVVAEVIS